MANKTKIASSRAALLGASGLSIPVGGTVETRGFLTEGDGGGGLYKEVSAPATPLQTNPAYTHIAGDRWLQLVPQGGITFFEQFGGKADSDSGGVIEFLFNVAPTAGGVLGWTCVASGTPGTWKAIPVPA